MKILCVLSVAILITLFHILSNWFLEEKIKITDLIKYYLKATVIINIIMLIFIKIKYGEWLWNYNAPQDFFMEYFLTGSFFGLFTPALYYTVKEKKNNILNINKKYQIWNSDNFKKMIQDNKCKVPKTIFYLSGFALFFTMDFSIRYISSSISNFSSVFSLAPTVITLTYCFIFVMLMYYTPKKVSYPLAIFLYVFNFAMFLTNYFLLKIKSEAFSIYELHNTKEGFAFLNFLVDKINLKLVLTCILIIVLAVINFITLTKIKREKTSLSKMKIFKIIIVCFVGFMLGNIALKDYDIGDWQNITYERYYYNNFVNPKKSLTSLGLYEYTLRDIHLYFKEKNQSFGSREEIEKLIAKYHTEHEPNKYSGIFKDKNLIMIMLESIDYVAITEDAMPTLYKMMNEGWTFKNRYSALATGGSTIATEYTSMTSLYYKNKYYSQINNGYYPYSLPNMFNYANYQTCSVHENNGVYYNREMLHKHLGFENSYFLYDMLNPPKYYIDAQIVENDLIYEKIVSKDNKFMTFIITIAAHGPYDDTNYHCEVNEKTSTELECLKYLSSRTDDLLKILLERLEEDGLLDDTIIVMYTDHQAYSYNYTSEDLEMFTKVDEERRIKSIPLVIYNPQLEKKEFDVLVNDIDIVPTILNLFGIEYDPDNYVGRDLLSDSHKDLIMFTDYSWYDGTIYSENKSAITDQEYYKNTTEFVIDKINLSDMIVSNNYYE